MFIQNHRNINRNIKSTLNSKPSAPEEANFYTMYRDCGKVALIELADSGGDNKNSAVSELVYPVPWKFAAICSASPVYVVE